MEQQGVIRKVGEGEPTEWDNSRARKIFSVILAKVEVNEKF